MNNKIILPLLFILAITGCEWLSPQDESEIQCETLNDKKLCSKHNCAINTAYHFDEAKCVRGKETFICSKPPKYALSFSPALLCKRQGNAEDPKLGLLKMAEYEFELWEECPPDKVDRACLQSFENDF